MFNYFFFSKIKLFENLTPRLIKMGGYPPSSDDFSFCLFMLCIYFMLKHRCFPRKFDVVTIPMFKISMYR